MGNLYKIGKITEKYNITSRTLRYYEDIGILDSQRKGDGKYRFYDKESIQRLEQIITLRKLQLSIKDIQEIFQSKDMNILVEKLKAKRDSVVNDVKSLEFLKDLLDEFMFQLIGKGISYEEGMDILQEREYEFSEKKYDRKEEDINMAIENIEKLNKNEVRIIDLKPFRVASMRAVSATPEKDVWEKVVRFVRDNNLDRLHSTRYFGFNNPNPTEGNPVYGYEVWVTVSDDIKGSDDVEIKEVENGLYAVTTTMSAAEIGQRWGMLHKWVEESDYQGGQHQWMEESLVLDLDIDSGEMQMDLYYPIKK